MTDAELKASLNDGIAFRLTLYGEARGEPIEGRIAIGTLIRNRLSDGRWGSGYRSVCLARWQFSCWEPKGGWDDPRDDDDISENYEHLIAITRALVLGGVPPWTPVEEAIYHETAWVVEGVMSGIIRDRVKRATHYYAPLAMPAGKVPSWAINKSPVVEVGKHLFFAGIA